LKRRSVSSTTSICTTGGGTCVNDIAGNGRDE
jgi:hypothetical protein